ncbi:MerR family transcriptional regulator [Rubrobacter indicoceani]|uniref:MerR family transcriptional regulator n=1 Tax=Rubrobacter indicoceani TaxID=2051957 RepID=UPI000E5AF92D|nr:MerR family transcriptional regulator [Rubrobacter indicoceani]
MATRDGSLGFSIGEVSRSVGLAPQTLRLWEREELVSPGRTGRGYRVYSEYDVKRLRKIKYLRTSEGLNFAAIRKSLGPPESTNGHHAPGPEVLNGQSPGERLRRLRMKTHKTLKEVAEITGLSISFISALERGGSGASVASLKVLASAYGITTRELFGADLEEKTPLVRADERPVMTWENGIRFEEMACGDTAMDPSYIKVPAGAGSEGFYAHEGEEFVYIVKGIMYFELTDREVHALGPGDTFYFHSTIPHRWWAGEEDVEAVYVNTPPTF